MPKVVRTPTGVATVLTEEEYGEIAEAESKKTYRRLEDGTFVCDRCNELLIITNLNFVGLMDDSDSGIPTYVKALEDGDILQVKIAYCVFCDSMPDLIGFLVAMEGSFHNRPH